MKCSNTYHCTFFWLISILQYLSIYIYIRLHSNTADKFTWWINTNNHQCVYILIISKFIINIKLSKQRCSVSQLCQAVTCGHWWQLMLSFLLPSDLIWDLSVAPLLVQLTGWTNAVDNFWWRCVPDERIGNIFFWGDIFIFFLVLFIVVVAVKMGLYRSDQRGTARLVGSRNSAWRSFRTGELLRSARSLQDCRDCRDQYMLFSLPVLL